MTFRVPQGWSARIAAAVDGAKTAFRERDVVPTGSSVARTALVERANAAAASRWNNRMKGVPIGATESLEMRRASIRKELQPKLGPAPSAIVPRTPSEEDAVVETVLRRIAVRFEERAATCLHKTLNWFHTKAPGAIQASFTQLEGSPKFWHFSLSLGTITALSDVVNVATPLSEKQLGIFVQSAVERGIRPRISEDVIRTWLGTLNGLYQEARLGDAEMGARFMRTMRRSQELLLWDGSALARMAADTITDAIARADRQLTTMHFSGAQVISLHPVSVGPLQAEFVQHVAFA